MIIKSIFLIRGIRADGCKPGSSECRDNEMRVCDLNGKWVSIDCPNGTDCTVSTDTISCKLNARKQTEECDTDGSNMESKHGEEWMRERGSKGNKGKGDKKQRPKQKNRNI